MRPGVLKFGLLNIKFGPQVIKLINTLKLRKADIHSQPAVRDNERVPHIYIWHDMHRDLGR